MKKHSGHFGDIKRVFGNVPSHADDSALVHELQEQVRILQQKILELEAKLQADKQSGHVQNAREKKGLERQNQALQEELFKLKRDGVGVDGPKLAEQGTSNAVPEVQLTSSHNPTDATKPSELPLPPPAPPPPPKAPPLPPPLPPGGMGPPPPPIHGLLEKAGMSEGYQEVQVKKSFFEVFPTREKFLKFCWMQNVSENLDEAHVKEFKSMTDEYKTILGGELSDIKKLFLQDKEREAFTKKIALGKAFFDLQLIIYGDKAWSPTLMNLADTIASPSLLKQKADLQGKAKTLEYTLEEAKAHYIFYSVYLALAMNRNEDPIKALDDDSLLPTKGLTDSDKIKVKRILSESTLKYAKGFEGVKQKTTIKDFSFQDVFPRKENTHEFITLLQSQSPSNEEINERDATLDKIVRTYDISTEMRIYLDYLAFCQKNQISMQDGVHNSAIQRELEILGYDVPSIALLCTRIAGNKPSIIEALVKNQHAIKATSYKDIFPETKDKQALKQFIALLKKPIDALDGQEKAELKRKENQYDRIDSTQIPKKIALYVKYLRLCREKHLDIGKAYNEASAQDHFSEAEKQRIASILNKEQILYSAVANVEKSDPKDQADTYKMDFKIQLGVSTVHNSLQKYKEYTVYNDIWDYAVEEDVLSVQQKLLGILKECIQKKLVTSSLSGDNAYLSSLHQLSEAEISKISKDCHFQKIEKKQKGEIDILIKDTLLLKLIKSDAPITLEDLKLEYEKCEQRQAEKAKLAANKKTKGGQSAQSNGVQYTKPNEAPPAKFKPTRSKDLHDVAWQQAVDMIDSSGSGENENDTWGE